MESAHFVASLVATIIGLLLVASLTFALAKRFKLPYSVMLVIAGMLLTGLARYGPGFFHPITQYTISPEVILFVFLPTLIYESAFNLDSRQLSNALYKLSKKGQVYAKSRGLYVKK